MTGFKQCEVCAGITNALPKLYKSSYCQLSNSVEPEVQKIFDGTPNQGKEPETLSRVLIRYIDREDINCGLRSSFPQRLLDKTLDSLRNFPINVENIPAFKAQVENCFNEIQIREVTFNAQFFNQRNIAKVYLEILDLLTTLEAQSGEES
jgi:hypothetical protein